jgi:hypothetical protein
MIDIFKIGTRPEGFAIQNGVLKSSVVRIPSDPVEICQCVAQDCERTLTVYGSLDSDDERFNDKTSFIYKVMAANDTVDIKLFKNDIEIETLNTNDFGLYFALGDVGTGDQLLYSGYLIEWQKVLQIHGVGEYVIKADLTQFGNPTQLESVKFTLKKYSDQDADGSVKIVSFQNGYIENSPFDFTGLNWYQQIRINGILWNKQSEYISDTYFTSNRTITQIQDSIEYTYDLQIEFVQDSVSKFIIENNILANEIYISDYNLTNTSFYNQIPLAVKEISQTTELYYYNGRSHVIQFTDRVQNIRKRNYK